MSENRKKLILTLAVIFLLNIVMIFYAQEAQAAYKRGAYGSAVRQMYVRASTPHNSRAPQIPPAANGEPGI